MEFLYYLIVIGVALVLAFEDFSKRKISWWWLAVLFICILFKGRLSNNSGQNGQFVLINAGLLVVQLLLLTLYFSAKNKRPVNIIDTYLGLGDILMLFVLCFAFHPVTFMLFYLAVLFLAISAHALWYRKRMNRVTIPLVSFLSIGLIICTLIDWIAPQKKIFYSEEYILQYLQQYLHV